MASTSPIRTMVEAVFERGIDAMPDGQAAHFRAMQKRIVDAVIDTLSLCAAPQVFFHGLDCIIYGQQRVGERVIEDAAVTVVVNRHGIKRTITDYETGRITAF